MTVNIPKNSNIHLRGKIMSEFIYNARVVKIEKLDNHFNADSLDIAIVLENYPVIVRRGEYKVGDLVAYIPVDSIYPDTEEFYFLCRDPSKYKVGEIPESKRIIKAKKIRGVFSMGLIVNAPIGMNEGDSIIEYFNLKKWEEEEEENIKSEKIPGKRGFVTKGPSNFVCPYYDIESIRKIYNSFAELNEPVVISEKIHGANAAYVYDDKFYVKSRNLFKSSPEETLMHINNNMPEGKEKITFIKPDMWWDIAYRFNLEDKCKKYPRMIFYGEIYGVIPKFPYDKGVEYSMFRCFDIYDVDNHRYVDHDEFIKITTELDIPIVPILYIGKLPTFKEIEEMSEGVTMLGGKHIREGVVIKTIKENSLGKNCNRSQVKFVSQTYQLNK